MAKLPSFQFYPGDWTKDFALRFASLSARGLLIDLLCLCFEAPRRGVLTRPDGITPLSDTEIVDAVSGGTREEKLAALAELEERCVLSRDEAGCLYSRRMVRDEEIRLQKQLAGSKGGSKAQAQRQAEDQADSQAEGQAKSGSSSSSSASAEEEESTNVDSSVQEPAPPTPSEFTFPTTSGRLWPMPQLVADQYQATYGDRIDLRHEFGKARQWLMDNKTRRPKGATGMRQFLTRWMNRADEHRQKKQENEPPAANGEAKRYNPETGLWYDVAKGDRQ